MEQEYCACGIQSTHKCTQCSNQTYVCRNCISTHLASNPKDSFISLNKTITSMLPMCQTCDANTATLLQVTNTSALPACKTCREVLEEYDPIFIPIKWQEIVTCTNDMSEMVTRTTIRKQALEEVDKNFSTLLLEKEIIDRRDEIIQEVMIQSEEKLKELRTKNPGLSDKSMNIKKDIEKQIFKKNLEISTIAGKLIDSLMRTGVAQVPHAIKSKNNLVNVDVKEAIKPLFASLDSKRNAGNQVNVYLFNPGKNTLTIIDVDSMTRRDLVFNRNWTFEASWCELETGEIFFCGGNGINSSEVLVVDAEDQSVVTKRGFAGRAGHSIVEINGSIYVFGGNRGSHAEKYRFDTDDWEQLAELPSRVNRISVCKTPGGIFMAGVDCTNVYMYDIAANCYRDLGTSLDFYKTKNKIVFFYENTVYCLCGDKLLYTKYDEIGNWRHKDISDRDWWSYSKPVVHKGCVYFIKYFVRNLWRLDLSTLELSEKILSEIELTNRII